MTGGRAVSGGRALATEVKVAARVAGGPDVGGSVGAGLDVCPVVGLGVGSTTGVALGVLLGTVEDGGAVPGSGDPVTDGIGVAGIAGCRSTAA